MPKKLFGATDYEKIGTATVCWVDPIIQTQVNKPTENSWNSIEFDLNGIRGGKYHYQSRLTAAQDTLLWETACKIQKGTTVLNTRMWSMTSIDDLDVIKQNMGLQEDIPMGMLRENICVDGFSVSVLLPGTQLVFRKKDRTKAVLTVSNQNAPCFIPAGYIKEAVGTGEKRFEAAAFGLRGLVGIVFKPGKVEPDYKMDIYVPKVIAPYYESILKTERDG